MSDKKKEKTYLLGVRFTRAEQECIEKILRTYRLLNLENLTGMDWKRKAFMIWAEETSKRFPVEVYKLGVDEPGMLEERMNKWREDHGRDMSQTGRLEAFRRWRKEYAKKAKEEMRRSLLIGQIVNKELSQMENTDELEAIENQIEEDMAIEEVEESEKIEDIDDLRGVVEKAISDADSDATALVVTEVDDFHAQIIPACNMYDGFVLRATHGSLTCWMWIAKDYDIVFPDDVEIEDILGFNDLTEEEKEGYI
jgi:hypothetical protein